MDEKEVIKRNIFAWLIFLQLFLARKFKNWRSCAHFLRSYLVLDSIVPDPPLAYASSYRNFDILPENYSLVLPKNPGNSVNSGFNWNMCSLEPPIIYERENTKQTKQEQTSF